MGSAASFLVISTTTIHVGATRSRIYSLVVNTSIHSGGQDPKERWAFSFAYDIRGLNAVLVPGWTRTHGFFMLMGGFHLFRLPADTRSVPLAHESSEPSDFVSPSGYSSRE